MDEKHSRGALRGGMFHHPLIPLPSRNNTARRVQLKKGREGLRRKLLPSSFQSLSFCSALWLLSFVVNGIMGGKRGGWIFHVSSRFTEKDRIHLGDGAASTRWETGLSHVLRFLV